MTNPTVCVICGRKDDPGDIAQLKIPVWMSPVETSDGEKLCCSLTCAMEALDRWPPQEELPK